MTIDKYIMVSARGDGHGLASCKGFGDGDDGFDRGDLGAEFEEDGFLVLDRGLDRQREAVALVHDLDDARSGDDVII